ncbi:glycoside hydrolase family 3 C-terminal domain-containing protein [Bifidobacterium sp. ESL0745]|uniref:glycoside hydrolase family 3 C-terminal domain-containing protein n=1 Tax=Bifidobacterium sp. ESL0745 TaxID=2983226 RepID=UPI0023F7A398|nr:glycoside hydrolase family 3 C-terminal domain-containing protein [Bifidobacterium sp. ESL0745]MDF7666029.1 glycoside hydrolase family 3 C-terminal domain-containing protein [Bifidobacterium sp. ESL0745]
MKLEELSVTEKAALLSGASEWDSRGNERAGIPSFVMSDGPNGVRRQLGAGDHLGIGASKPATCFPTSGTVANSWDPALAEEVGKALGREAHDLDVNVLLGPGLNIKRNPLCGRNFEYYSEDPQVAGHMAAGLVKGIQSNGIASCPKHFAANSQELRRQASNSVVDERTLRELYLTGFEIMIREARPWAIMTSYNQINGTYAHENKHLLTEILRQEWGFDGAVISDWGGSNSAVAAVKAGGTLEMPAPGYTSVRELVGAVKAGTLSEADLNVRADEVAKLAERTRFNGVGRDDLLSDDIAEDHHKVARHVAENTAVLLKNDVVSGLSSANTGNANKSNDGISQADDVAGGAGQKADTQRQVKPSSAASDGKAMGSVSDSDNRINSADPTLAAGVEPSTHVLPLQHGTRVAVIGDMAKTARFQGSGSSKVNATREENLLDELKKIDGVEVAGYQQGYERHGGKNSVLVEDAVALAAADTTDVIIAVVGLDERSESEGLDRSTMAIPQGQNELVKALTATGKPVVIVLVSGSPVELPWFDDVSALLYIGLSGQAGASAAARVLTGAVNPSGHLAETWPLKYEDAPSSGWYPAIGRDAIYREGPFVGYRYYETAGVPVRFPFGYGLSYSTFTYSGLSSDEKGVTFTVTNDSDVPGATVAQMYVRGPKGGAMRPDRELKGFRKVFLDAHETKTVTIPFDCYTFRHYDVVPGTWKTETGEREILVGDSVENLPFSVTQMIQGDIDLCPPNPVLGHYLKGQVKDVTDNEMTALFGHGVVAPGKTTVFGENDPISSWADSRGFVARTVAKTLARREAKTRQKTGQPDLNMLFILNMPPRAMCKMTQGMIDSAMVQAVVKIANGHTFRGIGSFIAGYFRNISANKRIAKELENK